MFSSLFGDIKTNKALSLTKQTPAQQEINEDEYYDDEYYDDEEEQKDKDRDEIESLYFTSLKLNKRREQTNDDSQKPT